MFWGKSWPFGRRETSLTQVLKAKSAATRDLRACVSAVKRFAFDTTNAHDKQERFINTGIYYLIKK